jgi:hypothetical protein
VSDKVKIIMSQLAIPGGNIYGIDKLNQTELEELMEIICAYVQTAETDLENIRQTDMNLDIEPVIASNLLYLKELLSYIVKIK